VQGRTRVLLESLKDRIEARKAAGFVRDGHGDLHCRNIFLTQPPVIFDCIEFSEELRTLDVLSEIGFLCMDLERFGRSELADAFLHEYLEQYPCVENDADRLLLIFYKMYRANVRMKVTALAVNPAAGLPDPGLVASLEGYFEAFDRYAHQLFPNSG
jgi:aminoglycoside phosphotransferase family enzyme